MPPKKHVLFPLSNHHPIQLVQNKNINHLRTFLKQPEYKMDNKYRVTAAEVSTKETTPLSTVGQFSEHWEAKRQEKFIFCPEFL